MFRWRVGLRDFCLLVAGLLVGLGLAYRYDFFHRGAAAAPRTIQPGEALAVGALTGLGFVLLGFWRGVVEQREEVQRQQQEELAQTFETALSKFVIRQPAQPRPEEEQVDAEPK